MMLSYRKYIISSPSVHRLAQQKFMNMFDKKKGKRKGECSEFKIKV